MLDEHISRTYLQKIPLESLKKSSYFLFRFSHTFHLNRASIFVKLKLYYARSLTFKNNICEGQVQVYVIEFSKQI